MIVLERVSRSFAGEDGARVEALRDVSLRIGEGEFVCIAGPSGAGKTTLMNILGCLDKPSSGSYQLAGREVGKLGPDGLAWLRRRAFGFVFQACNLVDSLTALENVELPARYAGLARKARRKRAWEMLSQLGLASRADHSPAELSGGEQQRVTIARALMNGAQVILADEPTGALDSENSEDVLGALENLAGQGRAVILVSHNPEVGARAGRRIELRDGQVVSDSGPARANPQTQNDMLSVGAQGAGAFSSVTEILSFGWTALLAGFRRGARWRTLLPALCVMVSVGVGTAALLVTDGIYRGIMDVIEYGLAGIYVATVHDPGEQEIEFTQDDIKAIAQLPNVRAVSPRLQRHGVTVRRADIAAEMSLEGFLDLGDKEGRGVGGFRIEAGAHITRQEDDNREQVALLSSVARDTLFSPDEDPIGEQILVSNVPFRVKGVFEHRGRVLAGSPSEEDRIEAQHGANNWVHVPFRTAKDVLGLGGIGMLWAFVEDTDRLVETGDAIRELGIRRYGRVVFGPWHLGKGLEDFRRFRQQFLLVLGTIAGIALLAGNASVMSIMLMSVRQRRREIGIRMAVGARQRDILRQFLGEALAVSVVGSLSGALLVAALIPLARAPELPLEFSWWFFAAPLACALTVGALFAAAPALRAARIDPVAALAADA